MIILLAWMESTCIEFVQENGGKALDHRRERDRTFSRRSLHGQVALDLGKRIVAGEFPEGATLATEETASREWMVSRTAYREAIKVLTAKGLVESRPKTGTRVRPRGDWNMLDPDVLLWASESESTTEFADALFEFRLIIEPGAARLAARKRLPEAIADLRAAIEWMESTHPQSQENMDADLAIHEAILSASGNEFLTSLGHVVESLLARSFQISSRRPSVREASIPLHRAVCDRIFEGKEDEAEAAMARLLKSARADIEEIVAHEKGSEQGTADRK